MRASIYHYKAQVLTILLLITLISCIHTKTGTIHKSIQEIISHANAEFYLDQRIWYQAVHAEIDGHTIVLKGEAFFEGPVKEIIRKLRKAGYEQTILDSISYLPEQFDDDLAYGIITDPYVMGRFTPIAHKQEGTEMLYGEPIRLIRDAGSYFQVQSPVGYLGYIPKTALRPVDLNEWNLYHVGKQAIITQTVTLENDLVLNRGTRLPHLDNDQILLADGTQLTLSGDYYKIINPATNPLRTDIISSAKQYLGLPYVWGGRSTDGVDCSGFVMQSYAINNLYLPRDTDEIANVGRIIGFPGWTDAMLPGDLLFFYGSRRLVTHIAIYLGEGKVIHSLGSGVQIQSMNPDDPDYAERLSQRFIFAKRIFE